MYIVKSVYYQVLANKGHWIEIKEDDLPEAPTLATFITYYKTYLYTEHSVLGTTQVLDLKDVLVHVTDMSLSLQAALNLIDDLRLPHLDGKPQINEGRVIYSDAFSAGFDLEFVNHLSGAKEHGDTNNDWLALTRDRTSYEKLFNHTLVSINGYLHQTDYDINKFYVRDVYETIDTSKRMHVGLYSFEQIGKVTQRDILPEMVKDSPNVSLFDRTVIETGLDLKDYSVAISLGGYLHIADGETVRTIGASTVAIEWSKIPIIDRLLESREFLDLSSLALSSSEKNDSILNVSEIKSDEFIKAYLALNQSFLILIENTNIFTHLERLENSPVFNHYYGYRETMSPLISTTGKLLEYWKIEEYGVFSYFTPKSMKYEYLYKVADPETLVNLDDALVGAFPGTPEARGKAYLKHITTSQLLFK